MSAMIVTARSARVAKSPLMCFILGPITSGTCHAFDESDHRARGFDQYGSPLLGLAPCSVPDWCHERQEQPFGSLVGIGEVGPVRPQELQAAEQDPLQLTISAVLEF